MAIFKNLSTLNGTPLNEAGLEGRAALVVNVASRCGLTPQYTGLEQLQERYGARGFTVLGVPCLARRERSRLGQDLRRSIRRARADARMQTRDHR